MSRQASIVSNSAKYTAIHIPDEDLWAIRVMAECVRGRTDFDDLNPTQQQQLYNMATWLINKL